ncbi:hypothetical protein [Acinetobacter sp.]|uniref:hypothetical protein n=1 Tax=Acinetobacter sp. TaxID=472 RepID=UPI0038904006
MIIIIFITAILIESIGTYISVIGLTTLFGINFTIIALAIALDLGKIVTVSFVYNNWKTLPKLMKTYALIAACITMVITSAGASSYLSGEFQKAIMGTKEGETKVAILKEQQLRYQERKKQIDDQIANLPEKTTVNQRLRMVNASKTEQQALDRKIAQIDQELPALQVAQIGTEAKAGPIVAIAKAFKIPVEQAISWVIGIIIIVFDPLAIFLIIAGNFLVSRRKAKGKEERPAVEEQSRADITNRNVSSMRMGHEFPTHEQPSHPQPETPLAAPVAIFPDPPETKYETYTSSTNLELETETWQVKDEPEVKDEPIAGNRTQMDSGILKPVLVESPNTTDHLIKSNFIPLTVPESADEVPEIDPPPREEISRSSLGLVTPDPHTIVDGRHNRGFRPPDTIPK